MIIGFAGKMASGKDTYGLKVVKKLNALHYSFAIPLREELDEIIMLLRKKCSFSYISLVIHLTEEEIEYLYELLKDELENNAKSRTVNIRKALQYLGTEVRRKKFTDYWVDKVRAAIEKEKRNIVFTDLRFKNEVELIKELNGKVIYLEVSKEEQIKRIKERDNLVPTEESLNHPSEIALEDYPFFDLRLNTEVNNIKENTKLINNFINKERMYGK